MSTIFNIAEGVFAVWGALLTCLMVVNYREMRRAEDAPDSGGHL